MQSEDVLLIFLKLPRPGFVKTRLAQDIGDKNAAFLYRLLAESVLRKTRGRGFSRIVFYDPPEKKKEIIRWIGPFDMYPQRGKDLGARLSQAFKIAFKKGARRVIAIGTDAPDVDKDLVSKGFQALKKKECVLGPALDGGYYLIGLSRFYPGIFKDIPWSSKDVLSKTKAKLRKIGIKFSLLPRLSDIDSLEDFYAFPPSLALTRGREMLTEGCLKEVLR